MKKVLHIINGLGSGGAEQMLTNFIEKSSEAGLVSNVVVSLSDRGFFSDRIEAGGINVFYFDLKKKRNFFLFFKLVKFIKNEDPDVVVSWLYHSDLVSSVLKIFMQSFDLYWNIRCSNIDFKNYSFLTVVVVFFLSKMSSIPDGVIYNSEAGKEAHKNLGYKPKKWIYLPNGFDVKKWHPDYMDYIDVRKNWGISNDKFVIGVIARVDPQKDHDNFLSAFRRLMGKFSDVHAVLIGKNTEEIVIEHEISKRILCLGVRYDIPRLMRGLDLVVLPSAYGEGFPNVIGEAMASGIPCVSTDVGDAAKILGDAGIIVPIKDDYKLFRAMEKIYLERKDGENSRGDFGRKRIVEAYEINKVCSDYLNVFMR